MKRALVSVLVLMWVFAGSAFAELDDSLLVAQIAPEHGFLERMSGRWNTTIHLWPKATDTVGVEVKGRSDTHMTLEGRFLVEQDSTRLQNKLYNTMGVLGFDHVKRTFTMVWMDNHSTDMLHLSGAVNDSGNVLTLQGEREEPKAGKSKFKMVYRTLTGSHRTLEIWEERPAGQPRKVMEIAYRRAL